MNSHDDPTGTEELVRRWFEDLFSRGDLGVADEILAADVAYRGPPSLSPGNVTGPDEIREYVDVYRTAFPDLWYTVEETAVLDDGVLARWSATGTHESDLFDMEPTGEAFTVDGVNTFRVEDGRITAVRSAWDTLKMVQELGVVPPVGMAGD